MMSEDLQERPLRRGPVLGLWATHHGPHPNLGASSWMPETLSIPLLPRGLLHDVWAPNLSVSHAWTHNSFHQTSGHWVVCSKPEGCLQPGQNPRGEECRTENAHT